MKNILVLLAVSMVAVGAQAAKVGPAGCGLGNVVFGKSNQVLASTTNGTGMQTFGISSGTSNCVDGGRTARLENFINVNQVALANEAARGEGETIVGLAQILGCQNATALGSALKANYTDVFSRPEASSVEVSNGVQNVIQKNFELNRTCGVEA